jgi:hypothetical protein
LNFNFFYSLSPDLNPDENVGSMIKGYVRSTRPIINSEEELWNALELAYQRLSNDRGYFIELVESMPRRLQAVIDAEGRHTRY